MFCFSYNTYYKGLQRGLHKMQSICNFFSGRIYFRFPNYHSKTQKLLVCKLPYYIYPFFSFQLNHIRIYELYLQLVCISIRILDFIVKIKQNRVARSHQIIFVTWFFCKWQTMIYFFQLQNNSTSNSKKKY